MFLRKKYNITHNRNRYCDKKWSKDITVNDSSRNINYYNSCERIATTMKTSNILNTSRTGSTF